MAKILSLIIGGTLGTFLRYFFSGFIHRSFGISFPYGTLAVNILGCFIIGFLVSIPENKFLLGMEARLLLIVGFCGAFTTFSTFLFETDTLIKNGEIFRAFINVFGSVALGLVLFRMGSLLAENVF